MSDRKLMYAKLPEGTKVTLILTNLQGRQFAHVYADIKYADFEHWTDQDFNSFHITGRAVVTELLPKEEVKL